MKKLNILVIVALVLSFGVVAQAQIARVELLTGVEAAAREGGKREAAGDVFLDIEATGDLIDSITSFTLTYSAPLAANTVTTGDGAIVTSTGNTVALTAEDIDIEKGTIKGVPAGERRSTYFD